MAHESFEDPATAADLDRWFVSIKVDREERPDLDAVYMAAVQAFTGSGGWPMSVFCTPDGRPYFAGTYFPPEDRHGLPAFRRVLAALADAWTTRRAQVEEQAEEMVRAIAAEATLVDRLAEHPVAQEQPGRSTPPLRSLGGPGGPGARGELGGVGGREPFSHLLEHAVAELADRFDSEDGGFGAAPKFPRPSLVDLCLHHYRLTGAAASLQMATVTLDAMAAGGIYDHVAGGFARYSTDARWLVPHFEKMLTDQALMARTYLHAWQLLGDDAYLQVATETLDYVASDLVLPSGGLASSVDADAGGVEGAHAVFTAEQMRKALSDAGRADLYPVAAEWYGVTAQGNWTGTNVLSRPQVRPLRRPPAVEEARRILLEARRGRPQPERDTKVLLEWNAMAAAVLAEASSATGNQHWSELAQDLGELVFAAMRDRSGRWLRTLGSAQPAFAADHAWLVEAAILLSELTGARRWRERATEAAHALLDLFSDGPSAGLYSTGRDTDAVIVRQREWVDGAVPSANAVAAGALAHLAALTGDRYFGSAAEEIVGLAQPLLARQPTAAADLLAATAWGECPSDVVVAGDRSDLLDVVRKRWLPTTALVWGERDHSLIWEGKADGWAYLCRGQVCEPPAADGGTLASQLDRLITMSSGSPGPRTEVADGERPGGGWNR
jgi:uncharacterized protein YyaL (SSP411 family)